MGYLLSVDGGGTKTEFCIYDTETKESYYYRAGRGNYKSAGIEELQETLLDGTDWMRRTFGTEPSKLLYAVFGMSGCDSREDYRIIQSTIMHAGFIPEKTYLCNDGELAFHAQAKAPGIVIIAGTGSIVIGIDKNGKSKRVGGWGYGFSDIGSGQWIGNEAIKYTLLYCDGCSPYSPLCDAIRELYGAKDFEEFPYCITQIQEYSEIAKSAAEVVRLAEAGCEEAIAILTEGAEILARQVASVCKKMAFSGRELNIVCSGGVIASGYYRVLLEKKLREQIPDKNLSICQQKNTPSYGGIRLAMERLGKEKGIILQIFTGGFKGKSVSFPKIKEKLDQVLGHLPIKAVIIGWATDGEVYRQVKEYLSPWNVEMYLWLPVFSETGLLRESHLMTDFEGKTVESFHLKDEENFEFYCPSDQKNQKNVTEIYQEYFKEIGFDGVFLDKIRYGAFSNGLSGVFSCFCEKCRKKYQEYGIDVEQLICEMKKVKEGHMLLPTSYESGRYRFENPIWEQFFDCKANIIKEALYPVTTYFKKMGLKVGMDLFAPFLGYFSGQQAFLLADQADFVKPMMYRVTNAPAGLPFEYTQFLKETAGEHIKEVKEAFCEMAGIDKEKVERFDLVFVKKELDTLSSLQTDVYCGIEVNKIDTIAPVTPEYIEENIEHLSETDIDGFVLSWDLLSMPEEHLNRVISVIGG